MTTRFSEAKIKEEIKNARAELEPLTNEKLIMRALSSLVIKLLCEKNDTYYYTMANVLRERAEE